MMMMMMIDGVGDDEGMNKRGEIRMAAYELEMTRRRRVLPIHHAVGAPRSREESGEGREEKRKTAA